MKRVLIALSLFSITLFIIGFVAVQNIFRKSQDLLTTSVLADAITSPPLRRVADEATIQVNGDSFAYALIRVSLKNTLTLLPNFQEKKDVKLHMTENNCAQAINGGFYDTSSMPLGYFATPGGELKRAIGSDLINGFVWQGIDGTNHITSGNPPPKVSFGLQTGPMLIADNQQLPLNIHNDKKARRMAAGLTTNGSFLLMAIWNPASVYEGPLLADLPQAVSLVSHAQSLGIVTAINLDGGSASAFYNGHTSLSELTPVGSVFCIR